MSDGNSGTPEVVELAKYNRAKEDLRKANERVKELEPLAARVAELEPLATKATTLEAQLAELTTARQADAARWSEELALADVGLTDPVGRDVARVVYGRLPEKDRPTIADYVRSLSADGADVPKPLQSYFTKPAPAAQVVTPAATIKPPAPATKPATTGAEGSAMEAKMKAAEAEYRRTGDVQALAATVKAYDEYRRNSTGRP